MNGVRVGLHFKISRLGNPIWDFESLEVLGTQKTLIAHVTVVELSKPQRDVKVDDSEVNYFIQIIFLARRATSERQNENTIIVAAFLISSA